MTFQRITLRPRGGSISTGRFVTVNAQGNMRISMRLVNELNLQQYKYAELWHDKADGRFAIGFHTEKPDKVNVAKLYKLSHPRILGFAARSFTDLHKIPKGRHEARWDHALGLLVCAAESGT